MLAIQWGKHMAGVRKSTEKQVPKITTPKEICTIKEFLDECDINYDDHKKWDDGSCTFLISDLEEEQIAMLKGVGLKNLGYDLFYAETDEIDVNEKLEFIRHSFMNEEKSKWYEVINKLIEIERKCSSNGKECPFEPSILQLQIVAKWSGSITSNMVEFKDFITELNSFFIESLKNNLENKHKEHYFWKTIIALRHGYSHDTTKWKEKDKMKIARRARNFFQDAIEKEQPHTSIGFVTCQ
jgi:hypothetical protein